MDIWPVTTLVVALRCIKCKEGFKVEQYEDMPWVQNFGKIMEHADNVYSFRHAECMEEQ